MRWLDCQTCLETVGVEEAVADYIDPDLYVCRQCLEPVDQPELPLDGHRIEWREYDPSIADIGF